MNTSRLNRREFINRAAIIGAGAALALPSLGSSSLNPKVRRWQICCQMYTFRDRSFYEALEVISKIGIYAVEPAFFLPLSKEHPELKTSESLAPDMRREMQKRMDGLGIKMPNYYAPLEGDKSVYRKIFDFAAEMGVKTIVAEPPKQMFELLDIYCNEYKINLAIHNHPEGAESKYWNPDTLVNAFEGCSKHIGACPDTGHWVRSGLDPLESLQKFKRRIITIHVKDAAESGKRDSRDVPLGTGQAHLKAILHQLRAWNWSGVMTIEYEHQSPQLVEEVAQCVKFINDYTAYPE